MDAPPTSGPSASQPHRRPPRARFAAIAYTVLLTYLLVAPSPLAIFGLAGAAAQEAIDWSLAGGFQHLIAYAVLAALWTRAVRGRRGRLTAWSLAALHGAGTELSQSLIPQRECDGMDLLANLCGIAIGAWLVWFTARGVRDGAPDRGSAGATDGSG